MMAGQRIFRLKDGVRRFRTVVERLLPFRCNDLLGRGVRLFQDLIPNRGDSR